MPTRKFWIYTILLSLLICGAGLGELMIRRQTPASLYLLNKSLACTAVLLITLSYVLSAIHSFWQVPRSILLYRRYTGLVGYGYVVLHLVATFLTPSTSVSDAYQFPFPEYFLERPVAFIAATIGLGIFTYAFWLSLNPRRQNGTPQKAKQWRKKLRYGYVGVLFICVHIVALKFQGWVTWLETLSPTLPPLSLIISSLLLTMILIKILQLKKERRIFTKNSYANVKAKDT